MFGAKSVLLMTPFDRASNEGIKAHVDKLGFTLHLGPAFDNRIPGTSLNLSPDQLFNLVEETFRKTPTQAIYFQGATMDPLPIIQRIEDRLHVPVVTSNTSMIWNLLSRLGLNILRSKITGRLVSGVAVGSRRFYSWENDVKPANASSLQPGGMGEALMLNRRYYLL